MAEALPSRVGSVHWHDHPGDDRDRARMIYENVGDWSGSLEETGGYRGVTMTASASAGPVASLCHPPSPSAGPPPRWMLHVFDRSARDGARPRGPVLHGQPA